MYLLRIYMYKLNIPPFIIDLKNLLMKNWIEKLTFLLVVLKISKTLKTVEVMEVTSTTFACS